MKPTNEIFSTWNEVKLITNLDIFFTHNTNSTNEIIFANGRNQVEVIVSFKAYSTEIADPEHIVKLSEETIWENIALCDYATEELLNKNKNNSNSFFYSNIEGEYNNPVIEKGFSSNKQDINFASETNLIRLFISCDNKRKPNQIEIAAGIMLDGELISTSKIQNGGQVHKALHVTAYEEILYSESKHLKTDRTIEYGSLEKLFADTQFNYTYDGQIVNRHFISTVSRGHFTISSAYGYPFIKKIVTRNNHSIGRLSGLYYEDQEGNIGKEGNVDGCGLANDGFDCNIWFIDCTKFGTFPKNKQQAICFHPLQPAVGGNGLNTIWFTSYFTSTREELKTLELKNSLNPHNITVDVLNINVDKIRGAPMWHQIPLKALKNMENNNSTHAILENWKENPGIIKIDVTDIYGNTGIITLSVNRQGRELMPLIN